MADVFLEPIGTELGLLQQVALQVGIGLIIAGLFLWLRWVALYGFAKPTAKRVWRYKNYSDAAAALSLAHPGLQIGDEEMKRLVMLHFFGWDIAPGSEGHQLSLVRGTETKSFPVVAG
ncbi:hypothetical protein [Pseudomonas sp. NPDC089569]|uniref:hypothetical protein n=1 Tax=Pseudomonas sp. NPDC089569 TaxID=3390722 RepID=UPI003D036E10